MIENFFVKCRELWNKIIELMDIDNPDDFVEMDDYCEFTVHYLLCTKYKHY